MILKDAAHAKINLFLNVIGKREDGCHEIESVMQTITLADGVAIELINGDKRLSFNCNSSAVPTDETNLAIRAIHAFYDAAEVEEQDITLAIDKKIPVAAGLAGGSADAAAVLRMLNKAHDNILPREELLSVAEKLGADVPFCLEEGSKLCHGIGSEMSDCTALLPNVPIVITCPGKTVSSSKAYGHLDDFYRNKWPKKDKQLAQLLDSDDPQRASSFFFNIFDAVPYIAEDKSLNEIKRIHADFGSKAYLSGSGPALFSVFSDDQKAKTVSQILKAFGYFSEVFYAYHP